MQNVFFPAFTYKTQQKIGFYYKSTLSYPHKIETLLNASII